MLPIWEGDGCAKDAALKEVLKTPVDNGGRVLDTVHGGPWTAEVTKQTSASSAISSVIAPALPAIAGER